jgi:hypothetical protein
MIVRTTVKSIQDIMRQDVGVDGDAQRISQLCWMFFLNGRTGPRRGARGSRSLGGRRAATSESTLAGRHRRTWNRCNDWRRNSSRCSPTSLFRVARPPLRLCCNKRAPSPSFSGVFPIRSAAASSRAFRGRAATLPDSSLWSRRWPASGWSCSRRLRRASTGSPSLFNPATAPYPRPRGTAIIFHPYFCGIPGN